MGEVYKARDTRLDRIVAIKVLSAHIDTTAARERFEREARAVSSLNDPHICTLHDVGEQDGIPFLVLEYLEGETLAAALKNGPLAVNRALRYGVEIAAALYRAHRHGVTHRDLKPANVMLTKAGIKLLDFGLARVREATNPGEADTTATLTRDITSPGTIVGTIQYMAPEQLESKEADARSDLFAFGAVLYEMLTGRKAFQGQNQASLIAAILTAEPLPLADPQASIAPLPPALERVVRTCLAKDPDERWQSAGDLSRELKWIAEAGPQAEVVPQVASATAGAIPWAVAAAALLLSIAGFWLYLRKPAADLQSIRFTLPTEARLASHVRISPDGSKVAFDGQNAEGKIVIWIRPLDRLEARALPGTENARHLFWSPDNRYIGFFVWPQQKLKRIDPAGGQAEIICDAPAGLGGTWGDDGTILFGAANSSGIFRVSSAGGVPVRVTTPEPSSIHSFPAFLPDGRHFLYFLTQGPGRQAHDTSWTMVGSLDGKEAKRLAPTQYSAVFAPPSDASPRSAPHLLFVRDGILMAQEMDLKKFQVLGEPVRVADAVAADVYFSFGDFSVSRNGILALNSGLFQTELVWLDRAGNRLGPGTPADKFSHPVLSPSGQQAIFERMDPKTNTTALWQLDVGRGEVSLFARVGYVPVFFPDGRAVAFVCGTQGKPAICRQASGGAAGEETLWESDQAIPVDVSPDGRTLAYLQRERPTSRLGILPLTGEKRPRLFYPSEYQQNGGNFSPDGRWIAYSSIETGQNEVYVQPFPATGEKFKVSARGGAQARWSRGGKELFYLTIDGKMMAVSVKTAPRFEVGVPQMLLSLPADAAFPNLGNTYDVTADGQRFLVNAALDGTRGSPITIITNWTAALGR